ncbi:MAG TPA: beta-ketothiolase BktB [Bauldia sp.]|nr:beta-ketothiolase BktB [Bauldia sp.]
MDRSVVVVSAVRTAIGSFGGSLSGVPPAALAACVAREAIARSGLPAASIGHSVFGNVIHTEPRDAYLARVAAIEAGVPTSVPALTLNRLCGSGLEAVISAARMIMLGEIEAALAGGAESMSRAPYALADARWGRRMGEAVVTDMLLATLHDPFGHGHMGITAENVAADCGITREEQDRIAFASHRRAERAIAEGRFVDQIVPVATQRRGEAVVFREDEHVRRDADTESLARLRPAFRDGGTVTAGNASGINDGAAALVLMEASAAQRQGVTPLARLVSYGHSGVEPSRMGLGPVPAVRAVLSRAGLSIEDMSVIESNEAFAAQACAVARMLGFPEERTNPNGGAIALGHPVGATGAIILVKLLYELKRVNGRYGLATMCIGGGQGIAVIVERHGTSS